MLNLREQWPTLKRLLRYGKAHKKDIIIATLMLWLASIAEVGGPLLVSFFIDHFLSQRYLPLWPVVGLVVGFLCLQFGAGTLHYFQALRFNHVALNVVQQVRCEVFQAAIRQPLSAFDTQPVGQLISKVTNDTEVVKDLYVTVLVTALRNIALISTMLVAMFALNWKMTLVAMVMFPAVLTVMSLYQKRSIPIVRKVRSLLAGINDGFNETISGISVIQQMRQEARMGEKLSAESQAHYRARMQALRLDAFLLRPLLSLISASVLSGLLLVFGFSATGSIGVGVLYAFISYLGRLNEPLIELTSQQSMLQQAIVAGERIFTLMDAPAQHYGDSIQPLADGRVEVRNLSFAYHVAEPVLQQITLNVPDRGFLALVGHTGSGKSTLASLLMGYYPVQEGQILLGGQPLSTLSHDVLRHDIAMVQQDPVVLAATVYDNVALGREVSEEAVWAVLKQVELAELVSALPQGLHTLFGEQGNNLSVGQKQLLALARVLVQQPKVLILDEATANIDSGTERSIQTALARVRRSTTLIVIAHRLSTIVDADQIVVLHRGNIAEQGKHAALLQQQGRYAQMWQLQQVTDQLLQQKAG
ncbi:MAG: SmdB family multidrug efflux ABC transporter permease/ATP-binding protein [Plesiomonas sp.]|uniref:SmdB family multidrug efflux ABC transporter permease/ATP-binding protein n=2 Tax=Plesiomonas sp. TaxID=2486279 RepID=UPI003F3AEB31